MVNSIEGENSVAVGEKKEELVPPVFAADLAPNIRAGFDSTCDFILRSHAALTAQIAQLATRIDAMGDATARAPVQPPLAAQPATWFHAALLKFMIIDLWHPLMKENSPMTLIMYHNNDSLLLVLQVLIVYSNMIVTVLAMLVVFHLMMVVLDASNCPYLLFPVTADLMIIWSGRCAWTRFLLLIFIPRRRDFNLLLLNSPVMC
jgi:hypothetical protein